MVALAETRLLILVGLTGVGKSTAVKALEQSGLELRSLPGRRELTDERIIGRLQEQDGEPRRAVTDRRERFDYTRRYRELFSGGMAHALEQLDVASGEGWLLFDGLRGENEVEYAARALPRAWFLVLHAPNAVRVTRLLRRADAFDRVAGRCEGDDQGRGREEALEAVLLGHREMLGSGADSLGELVLRGEVALGELRDKLAIVASEHQNYSAEDTLAALRRVAPERTIEARSDRLSPEEIARRVAAALPSAEARGAI